MRLNLFHRKKQGYLLVQRCNEISSFNNSGKQLWESI